jgi:HEPN domain-containing protein
VDKKKNELAGTGPLIKKLRLELEMPHMKFHELMQILRVLKDNCEKLEMKLEIEAESSKGLSRSDYEDKVKEGLQQAGIEIIKEEISKV